MGHWIQTFSFLDLFDKLKRNKIVQGRETGGRGRGRGRAESAKNYTRLSSIQGAIGIRYSQYPMLQVPDTLYNHRDIYCKICPLCNIVYDMFCGRNFKDRNVFELFVVFIFFINDTSSLF